MGSVNLALNKSVSASSYVIPYSPKRAVDGSIAPTNRWLCNSVPAWFGVDLGAGYSINRWVVRHMPAAGWIAPNYCMSDFKLQASTDNVKWTDIDAVTSNTSPLTDKTFTPVNCRYVRVYVTKGINCNPQMASAMEFEVYSAPASQYLSNLQLSAGTVNPVFAGKTTFSYTANVANDVASITLKPTAEDSAAKITINGTSVASGSASTPINLNLGNNTITVVVTASDNSVSQTYTLTVVRKAPVSQYLSNLKLSSGTINPVFAGKTTFAYTTNVTNDVASITLTPTAEDSTAKITVNGVTVTSGSASTPINLNLGANTITVVVTASDNSASQTYTVTVTRAFSAYLSTLVINDSATSKPIGLTPAFSGHTLTGYTSSVDFTTSSITIIPTPEDSAATVSVTVNGTVLTGTQPTANLNLGDNNIIIQVKARDNSVTNQYTVKVTRKHSTYLSGISANRANGTKLVWDNPFAKKLTNYTIKTDASKVKIAYTLEDSTSAATFKVNNVIATSPVTVPNVVTIQVTSTFGIPSTTYTLTLVNG